MSSRPLLVLMALSSIFLLPGNARQRQDGDTIADLIAEDEIQRAESLLKGQTPSAETAALQGEIEYRRGDFDKAESFYAAAVNADPKNARAYFGQGKLALAKMRTRDAIKLFDRAVE